MQKILNNAFMYVSPFAVLRYEGPVFCDSRKLVVVVARYSNKLLIMQ